MMTKTAIKGVLVIMALMLLIPCLFAFAFWCYFVGVAVMQYLQPFFNFN